MAERKAKKAVTKQLQNSDQTAKSDAKNDSNSVTKKGKKVDKTLVIAISLCVAVALFVVGIVFLPEPITASIKLNEAKKFVAESSNFIVVINAPMEYDGILNDKEAVIRDGEASEFVEGLSSVLKNVKYSDTTKTETGVWKTKLVIYNATDEYTLYTDGEGIYIENNSKLIKYGIPEGIKSEYEELCAEIDVRLE